MTGVEPGGLSRLPCGWLSLDARGTVLAVNASLCRMLRVEPQVLQGRAFDSLLTRASRVLYQSYLQPLLNLHGHVEEFSLAFDLGDGQTLDAMIYTSALKPNGAEPQAAASIEMVVASMSKRRSIEDEMLRIKRAADHAPGMIFQLMQLADGSCHFPYTSEAIRRMYGVTSQQASDSAERLFGLLSPKTRVTLARSLGDAAEEERDWHDIFEVHLPGAPARWHEAHATPRRLANGVTLWHGLCADITERRALEAAAADRLALEKMHRERNEFLARVSHELRTPLNGILGFAQLIATDKSQNLSAEQHDRLDVLRASGRHLLALVDEVLEITTIESGHLHVELGALQLRPLLARALRAVAGEATAAQVLLLPLSCQEGLSVSSNEQRLHQVLANLLSNAIKYNRPGGTVQLTAHIEGQGVRVTVRDSGKGMSAAQCAALFQPFNRLGAEKSGVQGHGLGLVITRNLLSLMDATLEVDSESGLGSEFSILLPLPKAQATAPRPKLKAANRGARPPRPPALTATQATGQVLYVEDDEVNAILMSSVLGMRPQVTLRIAGTGAEALAAAQGQRVRLLLIDMHLPDTNGIELLTALRQIDGLQSVPAIMVSAGARQQDISGALAAGFAGYWTKPLDVDRTLTELDRLLPPVV